MKTIFKTPSFKVLFALTFCCLFAFVACKKDPVPPTKEELLTAKKWKISAFILTLPNGSVENILAGADVCEFDNFQKFETNGTVTEDEGATKCDTTDPQIADSGTWAFNTEKTQLTITLSGGKVVTTLLELSATTLKYSFDEDSTSDGKYTVTLTAL